MPFFIKSLFVILSFVALTLTTAPQAHADDSESSDAMTTCLKAWKTHIFGEKPKYKTMATSVKVFGLGSTPKDSEVTAKPRLVMVNPAVNVMGGTVYELLNPNGWYCFKANVNVMGGLVIKTCPTSHIASATEGTTIMGNSDTQKGVTVMGATKVEFVSCK
jgi:hypothetical protein